VEEVEVEVEEVEVAAGVEEVEVEVEVEHPVVVEAVGAVELPRHQAILLQQTVLPLEY
jgi:hypothetical protein